MAAGPLCCDGCQFLRFALAAFVAGQLADARLAMRRSPSILAKKAHLTRQGMQTRAMGVDTYFGFFARSFFTAWQGSITQQTRVPLSLEGVDLSATNALKLRWGDLETVVLPELVLPGEVPFVLALTAQDTRALSDLAQSRVSLQRMMEQAVSSAVEPINLITKRRNRLTGLEFSNNVTGLVAARLDGEVTYTMATGRFRQREGGGFALRLLVTGSVRDRIENRTTAQHTQRALFAISEGAYICSPQWEPPPPPPSVSAPLELSELLLHSWAQSFFILNDGAVGPRVFAQPLAVQTEAMPAEVLASLAQEATPLTVVRLLLNDEKAQEALVVLRAEVEQELMQLSKSAQLGFLGDLFRVWFSEAAERWRVLSGVALQWRVSAVRRIPAQAIEAVTSRLKGGGLALRQWARLDGGRLDWLLALPPHCWHRILVLTAAAVEEQYPQSRAPSGESPAESPLDREEVFHGTGWGAGTVPWRTVFPFLGDGDLQHLVRQLERVRLTAGDLAAIGRGLTHHDRDRWHEAMPVNLREQTEHYKITGGEAAQRQVAITQALIDLGRKDRLPESRLGPWLRFFSEYQWQRRQKLFDELLPLRHLVYGMDRASLSRLLYDLPNRVVAEALTGAEFPVLDQVRRAISPGFAVRLLDDIATLRPRTNAYTVQQAHIAIYRQVLEGLTKGRYLVRQTPSKRLRELLRWIDEPQ